MGLDSVEILMEVENTFGIRIPNKEAEHILTVEDFHNAVWRQHKQSVKCKSQTLFYQLRRYFSQSFQVTKHTFSLETSLNELFPKVDRRIVYKAFAERNRLVLPTLALTDEAARLLTIVGLIAILGGLISAFILATFYSYSNWAYTIPIIGAFVTAIISKLLDPFRKVIEPSSVRGFTEKVLAINYSAFAKDQGVNRKEMETVINHIISYRAGLELEEITPEKKIGDDLGID